MRPGYTNAEVLAELAKLTEMITAKMSGTLISFPKAAAAEKPTVILALLNGRAAASERERVSIAQAARAYLKARRARDQLFPRELFGEAGWDVMLDLYVNRIEGRAVAITDAIIASGVAGTTALRWIEKLLEAGLVVRFDDPNDKRRSFLELCDDTSERVEKWILTTFPESFDSPGCGGVVTERNDRIYRRAP